MTDAVRRRQPSPKSGFMYYYDPNNRNPRRWATVATAVYALLLIGSFALVSFDFRQIHDKPGDTITIDFTEPPAPEPPKPCGRALAARWPS